MPPANMMSIRRYGQGPFRVAVIHGGPGAAGEMAPVARELRRLVGVLEPLQSATSLEGQVVELRDVLVAEAEIPVTLVGWSWGACLSYILAARYPGLIGKLVLISSGPFLESDAAGIMPLRLARLKPAERTEAAALMAGLEHPPETRK